MTEQAVFPKDLTDSEQAIWLHGHNRGVGDGHREAFHLAEKATNLVALLDDAERNQGGLVSVDILKSANELRLELARWR